jgi:hypothetical protein
MRAHCDAIRAYPTVSAPLSVGVYNSALRDVDNGKARKLQVPLRANHQMRLAEIMNPLDRFTGLQCCPGKRIPAFNFIAPKTPRSVSMLLD